MFVEGKVRMHTHSLQELVEGMLSFFQESFTLLVEVARQLLSRKWLEVKQQEKKNGGAMNPSLSVFHLFQPHITFL